MRWQGTGTKALWGFPSSTDRIFTAGAQPRLFCCPVPIHLSTIGMRCETGQGNRNAPFRFWATAHLREPSYNEPQTTANIR